MNKIGISYAQFNQQYNNKRRLPRRDGITIRRLHTGVMRHTLVRQVYLHAEKRKPTLALERTRGVLNTPRNLYTVFFPRGFLRIASLYLWASHFCKFCKNF